MLLVLQLKKGPNIIYSMVGRGAKRSATTHVATAGASRCTTPVVDPAMQPGVQTRILSVEKAGGQRAPQRGGST